MGQLFLASPKPRRWRGELLGVNGIQRVQAKKMGRLVARPDMVRQIKTGIILHFGLNP